MENFYTYLNFTLVKICASVFAVPTFEPISGKMKNVERMPGRKNLTRSAQLTWI
jgi:hypothetical protein